MHCTFLLEPNIDSVMTLKETKNQNPTRRLWKRGGRGARSRYMQENKKAKTFQALFCAAQDFQNLISGEAAAVTRVFGFKCVNRP